MTIDAVPDTLDSTYPHHALADVPVGLVFDDLHRGVSDPAMDSMRLLSETALRHPKAISFASGRPFDGEFRVESLHRYLDVYVADMRERGVPEQRIVRSLFQYGPTHGIIRNHLARVLANDEGIEVPDDAVLVTHGGQEAMIITLRGLFAGPDDVLLTVDPCYVGISGAAGMLDIPVVGVPEGAEGLRAAEVARVAREVRASGRRPVACYVTPDFSNPSGHTMPLAERHALLEVAAELDLILIEDNPYGLFGRPDQVVPTLKALDTRRRVIYLGTLSKTVFPGARIGYVVADQPVLGGTDTVRCFAEELAKIKSMFTVHTAGICQAVAAGFIVEAGYRLREANRPAAQRYVRNMELGARELRRHFPPERVEEHGVRWNEPGGGFFLLVEVPFEVGVEHLDESAERFGVGWAPMSMFYVGGGGRNIIRLGLSSVTEDELVEGIARLANYIHARSAAA